jgi:hypothetical protein
VLKQGLQVLFHIVMAKFPIPENCSAYVPMILKNKQKSNNNKNPKENTLYKIKTHKGILGILNQKFSVTLLDIDSECSLLKS